MRDTTSDHISHIGKMVQPPERSGERTMIPGEDKP